jgi:hypothetical protein
MTYSELGLMGWRAREKSTSFYTPMLQGKMSYFPRMISFSQGLVIRRDCEF